MLSSNLVPAIDSCVLRIRTLSTLPFSEKCAKQILQRAHGKKFPLFFAMGRFFSLGTSSDKEAKRAIAVTAIIEEYSMKVLIVAQNSPNVRRDAFEPF